jgi:putative ABC transport system permease protein
MPTTPYTVDGREAAGSASAVVPVDFALDNYFSVMGVPILRGRPFTREDSKSAPLVAVVSASFARQEWPGQDAIGHRIRLVSDSASRWRTIVGVAGDSRYGDIASASAATVYFSARQTDPGAPWYVVRTRSDPRKAIPLLEHTIQEADPAFGATRVTTGSDVLASRLSRLRVLTTLLTLLSVTALLLAATGLFGVLSAYVRERRRELGVRAALGASPTQLRALVLSQTVSMGIAGVVCGVPLAVATAHILRALIPDATPIGVPTLLAIAAVLVGVLGAAAYMPAVRAARVEIRETLAAE